MDKKIRGVLHRYQFGPLDKNKHIRKLDMDHESVLDPRKK